MITKISGTLDRIDHSSNCIELAVGPVVHEVLVTELVRRSLQTKLGQSVTLHTMEFLEGTPGRGNLVPRLVGFLSEVEREFFDLICEVDGVGVRKALRAIIRPVGEIATAIDEQDAKALATLPGIGAATAERMIAKLRRRMPKFALLIARETPESGHDQGRRRVRRNLRGAAVAGPLRFRRPPPRRRPPGREEKAEGRPRGPRGDLPADPQAAVRHFS